MKQPTNQGAPAGAAGRRTRWLRRQGRARSVLRSVRWGVAPVALSARPPACLSRRWLARLPGRARGPGRVMVPPKICCLFRVGGPGLYALCAGRSACPSLPTPFRVL
ncbi:unnamed protein product [Amoebophrya sp. A120]|nr:unnamed protein product [Amoebophrya sp. A120]|eukprot:GSA120T00007499001.1